MGRSKHTTEQKLLVLQMIEAADYTIAEILKYMKLIKLLYYFGK